MNNNFKIAYFAFSEEYGAKHAGFTHTFNIASSLSKLVNIKVFFNSKRIWSKREKLHIFTVIFPSLRNLFRVNPLKYIKSYFIVKNNINDVDIIHERFHVNPIDLLFIFKKEYILEINDPAIVLHDNFIYKYLINLKLNRCKAIITQTNTLKIILSNYTNKPIYVVSNGVDTSKFKPNIKNNIRKNYGIKNDDILVVFVGAFMQWHGVEEVLKLTRNFLNVKFLMVGNGPEFNNMFNESKNLKNLILVGDKSNDEVPQYLSAADIFIAPFNTRKFKKLDVYGFWWCPVKLFEYMASGKPVVSYNYYEVGNIVKDSGLLAKPGNFNDFNSKLKELISNKNLRLKLGKKARKIAMQYDWNNRAKDIYKIYKKCLIK